MREHAQSLMFFFDSSPRLFGCLTKLFLYNASFTEPDMHRLLLSCELLQNLVLYDCDIGYLSILKMDLPNSKLRALELCSSSFEMVQLICLPKLVLLQCKDWNSKTCFFQFCSLPWWSKTHLYCNKWSHKIQDNWTSRWYDKCAGSYFEFPRRKSKYCVIITIQYSWREVFLRN